MDRPPKDAANSTRDRTIWPPGNGCQELTAIADLARLESVCRGFAEAKGLTVELVGPAGTDPLLSSGDCEVCARFHRMVPGLRRNCEESRRRLVEQVAAGNGPVTMTCTNGLLAGATPIVVAGRHLANLICGQVLAEPLDEQRSRELAAGAGIDADAYVKALASVGILTADGLRSCLAHLGEVASALLELELNSRQRQFSEERFSLLADNVPGVIYLCRNDSRYTMLYISDGVEQLTGYPKDEFLSDRLKLVELFHPEDAVAIRTEVDRALEERRHFHLAYRIKHRDGGWRWIDETGCGIFEDGKLVLLEGHLQDTTDVKQAEAALRESERKFRMLAEQSLVGVVIMQDGQVKYANQAAAELYGQELKALLSMSSDELQASAHPADAAVVAEAIAMIAQGETSAVERLAYRMVDKHGGVRWVESYLRSVTLIGQPALMLTTVETTERVLAEQNMKAQRDMGMALSNARTMADAQACCLDAGLRIGTLDGGLFFLVDDASGTLVERCRVGGAAVPSGVQTRYGADSGFAALAGSGRPIYSDTRALATELELPRSPSQAQAVAIIPVNHDDRAIGCLCLFSAHQDEIPRSARVALQAVGSLIGNVIARMQVEEALHASEERHRKLTDESPVPWVVVRDGVFVYANRALVRLIGFDSVDQVTGMPMLEHVHPEDRETVRDNHQRRLAGENPPSPYDIRVVRLDGAVLWVELHVERCEFEGQAAVQAALVDITQPKQTERLRGIQRDLGVVLSGELPLEQALVKVLEAAKQAADAIDGALYLASEIDGVLRLEVPGDADGLSPPALPPLDDGSPLARAVAAGEPRCLGAGELGAECGIEAARRPTHQVVIVPITDAGEVLACLWLSKAAAGDLPAAVLGGLEYIAGQAGSAIARLRVEEALRASEERYRRMMNDSPVPMVVVQDGAHAFANPAAIELLGLTAVAGLVGLPLGTHVHPDDKVRVREMYESRMAGGDAPPHYELRMLRPDGSVIWVEVHAQQIDYRGRPAALAALVDITERRQAERALRQSQQMLQLVLDNVPQFIFWKDVDSVYTGCNRNFARAAGVKDPADIVGKTDYDLPWEADQAEMFRLWDRRVMDSGTPEYHIIEPQLQADGKHAWLDTSKIPLRDADGNVVGVLGSYEDITERKLAEWQLQEMNERLNAANDELIAANEELNAANEELARSQAELQASEERFRTLAEAPHTAILFVEEGRILDVNRAAEKMFGVQRAGALGKLALDYVAPESAELVTARIQSPSEEPYEIACIRSDGTKIMVEVRAKPLPLADRRVMVISLHDITQRKRTEVVRQILLQIAEATSTTEGLEALLRIVRRELSKLLDAKNMFVALYDEASGRYSFPYAQDEQDTDFSTQPLTDSLAEHVRTTGSVLLWNAGQDRPVPVGQVGPHGPASQSWLGVPLRTVRGVSGVLAVQSYDESLRFTEQDAQLLELVSGSIAMAIERKQALEALRASEERYRAFVEQSSEAIWCFEFDEPLPVDIPIDQQLDLVYERGYLAECNDAMARMYGFDSADEIVGSRLEDLMVRSDPANVEYLRSIMESGYRIVDGESHERDRHGASRYYLNNVVGVVEAGHMMRAWGTQRDVTDRRRAEEALRSSETQYRTTLESMGDAIHVIDRDYRVLLHNNALAEWHRKFGLGGEIEGRSIRELYPHLPQQVWDEYRRVMETGEVVVAEEINALGGQTLAVESRKIPVVEKGQVVRVITILRDIDKRKQAEAALRGSEERHRRFVEGTIDLVLQVDGEGRLTYVNPTAARVLQIDPEESLGSSVWEFVHPEERQRTVLAISRMIREQSPSASYESRIISIGGEIIDVLWTVDMEYAADGELAGINAILHDITEHKRLTQQLIREQKEESMLTLAGGLAHDFNNILMGVLGSATLLRDSQVFDPEGKDLCSAIVTSSERMVDLTSKLLAYARGGRRLPQPVDVNLTVRDTLSMVRGSISGSIAVALELADDLWPVEADPGQLHQVFLNLILNAAEAMRGGGRITVTTGNVHRDRDWTCAAHERHAAGDYACVKIADNGHGMDAHTLARIFEPFFSTKFQGRGLGLAAAKGIVLAHGGCIHAHSRPGEGSQFHVYLPRTDKPLPEMAAEPFVSVRCEETILVVDDEDIVRRTACRMLERQGFTVLAASGGVEGLELFRQHQDEIALVMFDMSMPQMSGAEFYGCLRQLDERVKAIAVSGYSEAVALAKIDTGALGAFVQKPFAFKTLVSKVREVLDG